MDFHKDSHYWHTLRLAQESVLISLQIALRPRELVCGACIDG